MFGAAGPAGHVDEGRHRSRPRRRRGAGGGRRAAVVRATGRSRRRPTRRSSTSASTSSPATPGDWEPGPDDLQQLRLRRPQRLASILTPRLTHPRVLLRQGSVAVPVRKPDGQSGVDDDEQEVAAAGDLAVEQRPAGALAGPRRHAARATTSSVSSSPGPTWRRKRAPSRPPNSGSLPAKRSSVSTAMAPTWAIASHISTPGSVGRPGKCPAKNHSSPVSRHTPVRRLARHECRRPRRRTGTAAGAAGRRPAPATSPLAHRCTRCRSARRAGSSACRPG